MRFFLFVAAGVMLAGCSSTSMDFFKSKPTEVALQLVSTPPGATATTSLGQSCVTPCSVQVATAENFTVTYGLAKYQPATVSVTVTAGSPPIFDPNPATAELQLITPARKPARRRTAKPKAAAPAAPAAGDSSSPFPPPPAAQ